MLPRALLASAFWLFLLIDLSNEPARTLNIVVNFGLSCAAFLVVIRRVGWWSLVMPYVRPVPFLGYWLWVFYAWPNRRDGWMAWAAWLFVLSPFMAPFITIVAS